VPTAPTAIPNVAAVYEPYRLHNLLNFSKQFNNALWSKVRSSVTADVTATADPVGGFAADLLVEDTTATNTHFVTRAVSVTGVATLSVYAKAAGRNFIALSTNNANTAAWFNLSSGTVGTKGSAVDSSSIQSIGNGWYRCVATFSSSTFTGASIYLAAVDGSTSYTGDGTSGVYLWGAQLEVGSTATAFESVGPQRQVMVNRAADQYHGDLGSSKGAMLTGYGLRLPGTSGNFASTPDSAALSITGDIDIRCKVTLSDWTPATNMTLVSKWVNLSRDFELRVATTGVLVFARGDGAGTSQQVNSSAATGIADGTAKWVRVTHRLSDHRVQFFLSDDGSSWTQLGTNQTMTAVAPGDGTAPVEIGMLASVSFPLAGRIFSAEIRNGIDGTVVASPDFTAQPIGAGQWTDSAGTVWTINTSAADSNDPTFAADGLSFATDDYVQRDQIQLWGSDFTILASVAAAAQSVGVIVSSGRTSSTNGYWFLSSGSTSTSKGRLVINDDSGNTLLAVETNADVCDGTPHTVTVRTEAATRTYWLFVDGFLDKTGTWTAGTLTLNRHTIGALGRSTYGSYLTGKLHALAQFQRALTDTEIAAVHAYYKDELAAEGVTLPEGPRTATNKTGKALKLALSL
jgi:hypothetical protein